MRKPKPSDLWLGFLSAALGFFFFLLSLGVFPGEGSDPWWLLSLAGLLFFFGGIFVFANHYRKKVELIPSIMLALFSLISFGIGVFIAYLAGKANQNINGVLHEGFWWFTAYCVLSILGGQLIKLEPTASSASNKSQNELA